HVDCDGALARADEVARRGQTVRLGRLAPDQGPRAVGLLIAARAVGLVASDVAANLVERLGVEARASALVRVEARCRHDAEVDVAPPAGVGGVVRVCEKMIE